MIGLAYHLIGFPVLGIQLYRGSEILDGLGVLSLLVKLNTRSVIITGSGGPKGACEKKQDENPLTHSFHNKSPCRVLRSNSDPVYTDPLRFVYPIQNFHEKS